MPLRPNDGWVSDSYMGTDFMVLLRPRLDAQIGHQIYYAEFLFPVTLKCRHMYGVLNINEIKN
jgi:hypothetical protein